MITPLALLLLASQAPSSDVGFAAASEVERHLAVMGTSLELRVGAADRASALALSERAVRALEAVEARLSTWTDSSELARLNAHPVGEPFALGDELASDLFRARELWNASEGAFDPLVGALVRAWDLRGEGRVPSPTEREGCLVPGAFAALELLRDEQGRPVAVRRHALAIVEEGGFGKGVGLDAALDALRAGDATSAVLGLGGQVAIFGRTERFAVAHPRERTSGVVELRISSGSFATSGNSERAAEVDGVRVGHLLDPRSGAPVEDFGSVTAFAPDATTADGLSTGFFVLGPERALELAAALEGVEALVLDDRSDALRIRATDGLRGRLDALGDRVVEWYSPAGTARALEASGAHR